ncbi:hypothetical protein BS50DRAFT_647823 [Corynespora cassiicola Philippines]|uniref:BTB domain-containing protein n=1 Tax=Corynespora cassiicola Philippines TaxID=1448308 RepID=A0A2T2NEY2_CORCC|nr:hypothetical protein BS50DRAFT_647823 [Corynespora cassiicola Philippines]
MESTRIRLPSQEPSDANAIIEIGTNHVRYHVPKPLLCRHSEYFNAALNVRWREGNSPIILETVEVAVWEIFLGWLYTQKVPRPLKEWKAAVRLGLSKGASGPSPLTECIPQHDGSMLRIMTYAFADRFLVSELYLALNRQIVDATILFRPNLDVIIFGFAHFHNNDPLLKLFVDQFCAYKKREWAAIENAYYEDLPADFLRRVSERALAAYYERKIKLTELLVCDYHGHKTDEERESCKFKGDVAYPCRNRYEFGSS